MNLIYNIAHYFDEADAWEREVYSFLSTKYDIAPYEKAVFLSAYGVIASDAFTEIVITLGRNPDSVILDWYCDAGPFKLYRSCIKDGKDLVSLLDVCQIDDDMVAVEAKLMFS